MVGLLHGWFTWVVENRVEHTVEKTITHFWYYLAGILVPTFNAWLKRHLLIFGII